MSTNRRRLVIGAGLALSAARAAQGAAPASRGVVLDTHLDTPLNLERPGFDIMVDHPDSPDLVQVDYPKLLRGQMSGGFWAIFLEQGALTPSGYAAARDAALMRAVKIREMVARHPTRFELAVRADDAEPIRARGRQVVFQSIENAYPLGTDLSLLQTFHGLGVRLIGLVHEDDNQFADSCTGKTKPWGGVSPLGRTLIREANRLGMVLDGSHCSDAAFDALLAESAAPILLSHSSCKQLCDHPRNLDDGRLKRLASAGGVIQLNTVNEFLVPIAAFPERDAALEALAQRMGPMWALNPRQSLAYGEALAAIDRKYPIRRATFDDFMRHMLHAIEVAGVDHVGIGLDWDGGTNNVVGLRDVSDVPKIWAALAEKGFSGRDIDKIKGGNTLRVLREAERFAGKSGPSAP